jgi:hypothetical protein
MLSKKESTYLGTAHFFMRIVIHPILKGVNWVLVGILSLLGFSRCTPGGELMYGVPWASAAIHGKVIDK